MGYLNKSIVEPNTGVTVKCWDLNRITYDAVTDTSEISYSGWLDHAAKEAGKAPVMTISWTEAGSSAPALEGAVRLYAKARALARPEFAGATEAPHS